MVTKEQIFSFQTLVQSASKVAIISHLNPDGDAIGSTTAAYHYLRQCRKQAQIIFPSKISESFQFLNPAENPYIYADSDFERASEEIASADLILCLDFNKLSRIENLETAISSSTAKKILIDHHLNPQYDEFDFVISCIETSSASEVLFWTLAGTSDYDGQLSNMPVQCAMALYTGMMTDTNNFSNSVLPSTFEMASKLIERGVDKNFIQEQVLNSYSADRMRLMGHMLRDKMVVLPSLKAAYFILTQNEKNRYAFQTGDSEGFVNLPLAIGEVQVSAFFTEHISSEGKYVKVSLRSKGDFDVNSLSRQYFNGGGHKNASGGRLYMPIRRVPQYFEKSLKEYIDSQK